MVGHKFGEFSVTRKYPNHNADKDDAGKGKSEDALIEAAVAQQAAAGAANPLLATKRPELQATDLLTQLRMPATQALAKAKGNQKPAKPKTL
jgi:hypothetical protein